jgi:hypothetical protein
VKYSTCFKNLQVTLNAYVKVTCVAPGTVIMLWAGQLRNCGGIPGRGNRLFSKASTPALGPTRVVNRRGFKMIIHPHLVSRVRMHKAIPPLPHLPSRRVHGQLYFNLRAGLTEYRGLILGGGDFLITPEPNLVHNAYRS